MGRMIFKPAARYPADPRAVFILALSVFSGLTALALKAAPDSLEALLPQWGVYLWGALLALGSGISLVGMKFQSVNGIVLEQIGSAMVAATTIFYSALVFYVIGPGAIQTVGIIMSWGFACIVRWIQLQVLIRNVAKRQEKDRIVAQVYAEIDARLARERAHR